MFPLKNNVNVKSSSSDYDIMEIRKPPAFTIRVLQTVLCAVTWSGRGRGGPVTGYKTGSQPGGAQSHTLQHTLQQGAAMWKCKVKTKQRII